LGLFLHRLSSPAHASFDRQIFGANLLTSPQEIKHISPRPSFDGKSGIKNNVTRFNKEASVVSLNTIRLRGNLGIKNTCHHFNQEVSAVSLNAVRLSTERSGRNEDKLESLRIFIYSSPSRHSRAVLAGNCKRALWQRPELLRRENSWTATERFLSIPLQGKRLESLINRNQQISPITFLEEGVGNSPVAYESIGLIAHPFAFASLKRGFGETQSALSAVAFAKADDAEILVSSIRVIASIKKQTHTRSIPSVFRRKLRC